MRTVLTAVIESGLVVVGCVLVANGFMEPRWQSKIISWLLAAMLFGAMVLLAVEPTCAC